MGIIMVLDSLIVEDENNKIELLNLSGWCHYSQWQYCHRHALFARSASFKCHTMMHIRTSTSTSSQASFERRTESHLAADFEESQKKSKEETPRIYRTDITEPVSV